MPSLELSDFFLPIYQNLNFILDSKNLPKMMKNPGSTSMTGIKSTQLKTTLLLWNSKYFFTPISEGYNFSPSQ